MSYTAVDLVNGGASSTAIAQPNQTVAAFLREKNIDPTNVDVIMQNVALDSRNLATTVIPSGAGKIRIEIRPRNLKSAA